MEKEIQNEVKYTSVNISSAKGGWVIKQETTIKDILILNGEIR